MKKSEKWKVIFKSKSLMAIVTTFVVAPLLINLGLVLTDIIYEKTGFTLTAKGLNNAEWLDFWKQYLEEVRQEEIVLVEVTQEFNTSMAYKALLQQANTTNIYDARYRDRKRNTEKIIELYERQGLCDEADASKQELKRVKRNRTYSIQQGERIIIQVKQEVRNVIFMLSKVFDLSKGEKMAGSSQYRLYRASYRGRKSNL